MKKRILPISLQIIVWILLYYLTPHYYFLFPFNIKKVFFFVAPIGAFIIIYGLMPRLFNRQYLPIFILIVFGLIKLLALLSGLYMHSRVAADSFYTIYFIAFFIIISISAVISGIKDNVKLKHLQRLQIETELNYLKAQVNPHFLFNTLNNLYATARVESPTTANGLLKLADLMRYSFTKSSQTTVLLTEEIAYLDNYIELEKMRLNAGAHVVFLKKGNFKDKKIAPMLLLPFVENAFKHGVEKQLEDIFVEINLSLQDNTLYFQIENNKQVDNKHPLERVSRHQALHDSIGTGLNNVRKRFDIGYPENHKIDITETNDKFCVKLWINL